VHAIFRNKSKCEYSFGEGKKERKNKKKDLGQEIVRRAERAQVIG